MSDDTPNEGNAVYCLYRWYDDEGILLYVGITHNLLHRTEMHWHASHWVDLAAVLDIDPDIRDVTKRIARAAELRAIHTEAPVFNWQDNEHVRERATYYWERRGVPPEFHYGTPEPQPRFPSPIGPMRPPARRDRPILESERLIPPRRLKPRDRLPKLLPPDAGVA